LNDLRKNKLDNALEDKIMGALSEFLPKKREDITASDFDFAIWKFSKTGAED